MLQAASSALLQLEKLYDSFSAFSAIKGRKRHGGVSVPKECV